MAHKHDVAWAYRQTALWHDRQLRMISAFERGIGKNGPDKEWIDERIAMRKFHEICVKELRELSDDIRRWQRQDAKRKAKKL